MPVQIEESMGGRVLEIHVTGKLEHEDYERFIPELERLVEEHGKIGVLFNMVEFHGWDAQAFWDDVKLDFRHHADFLAIAMVGDKAWQKGMATFCKPFTSAEIRYFDRQNLEDARRWIEDAVRERTVATHA
jgi:hypothetical protein